MTGVILVAASGLAREVLATLRARGRSHGSVGIVDEDPGTWGRDVGAARVLGGLEEVKRREDDAIVVCAGRGAVRRGLVARLAALGVHENRYRTVVHPSVEVPERCTVGPGSILLAGVVLTADVRIGDHVVVMPHATLTHDDRVDSFATLCAGVSLGGSVRVREAAFIGMNASVRQHVSVGESGTLGMGSVLLRDLPAWETWAGVPAARLAPSGGEHR